MQGHSVAGAFDAWYTEQRSTLPYVLHAVDDGEHGVELIAQGVNPALRIHLVPDSLSVAVEWNEAVWDFLWWDDAPAVQAGRGWQCAICQQEGRRRLFGSPEELWIDHLLMPLGNWLRETLRPARYLVLWSRDRGAAWAELRSAVGPGEAKQAEAILTAHI